MPVLGALVLLGSCPLRAHPRTSVLALMENCSPHMAPVVTALSGTPVPL